MFQNYKVVITGSTSGIGLATAKQFIENGATVIGLGRSFDRTKELGEKFIPCKCDVTDEAQIKEAVEFIKKTFNDELDTFVNAAGLGFHTDIKDFDTETFDKGYKLLLRAPAIFGRELYPLLLKSPAKNPSIVNVASAAGHAVSPDLLIYNLAKTAHILLTKQQAKGYIGVRSNDVCPGFIDTPIFGREGTDLPDDVKAQTFAMTEAILPIPRIGKPEEVANLICFLASEDAMYINGADVTVDAGLGTVVAG